MRVPLQEGDIVVNTCHRSCLCVSRVTGKRANPWGNIGVKSLLFYSDIRHKECAPAGACDMISASTTDPQVQRQLLFRGRYTKGIKASFERIINKRR